MSANATVSSMNYSGVYTGTLAGTPTDYDNTDILHQKVKLYIEGIEVPFISISINQTMGQLPTCEFEIPPQSDLMEIVRYYQPKVHVFYTDTTLGDDRLLFWGHAVAATYSRSRQGASASIHFRCRHRNALAQQIILYFGGVIANENKLLDKKEGATTDMNDLNSVSAITMALSGLNGVQKDPKDLLSPSNAKLSEADLTLLPQDLKDFEQRLIGMPSVIVNLWNQLKLGACASPETRMNLLVMFIPLFEQGLSFFKRLSGHYLLEAQQHNSRVPYCPDGKTVSQLMVPPAYRNGSTSAVQGEMAIRAVQSGIGASGEMTGFLELCDSFYSSIEYEMLTLASPAEVDIDPTSTPSDTTSSYMAVETIIKPQTPFYYSPVCNVVFPRMFHSISISQDEDIIPTRISAEHSALPNTSTGMNAMYRGPNTVREALSLGSYLLRDPAKRDKEQTQYDLKISTGLDFNVPGKYEQGRGIIPTKTTLPWWLVTLVKNKTQAAGTPNQETFPEKDSADYQEYLVQSAAWIDRYGYDSYEEDGELKETRNKDKDSLDPFSIKANVQPHERVMFAAVDYEFSKAVARARRGTIDGVFNPYIVPGYPMDVLDDSPSHPSFHGVCASVTHTITPRSIGSTINMVAAVTYSEMSNYYHPPLHPWLQTALGMINETSSGLGAMADSSTAGGLSNTSDSAGSASAYGDPSSIGSVSTTILDNPAAKSKADEFYFSVLGVGAADPSNLIDWSSGNLLPQARDGATLAVSTGESLPAENGGEMNPWLTTTGNLRLVFRNVETKQSISSKFQYNFMDLTQENYSGSSITYYNPRINSPRLLEPGASMFLDYVETKDFIQANMPVKATTGTSSN